MVNGNSDQWLGEVFPEEVSERVLSRRVTFAQTYDPDPELPQDGKPHADSRLSRVLADTRCLSLTVFTVTAEAAGLLILLLIVFRVAGWLL